MTKTESRKLAEELIAPLAHLHVARASLFLNSTTPELMAGMAAANMALEGFMKIFKELLDGR